MAHRRVFKSETEALYPPPSPDTIKRRQEASRKKEERAQRDWKHFKAKVKADDEAKAQARETEAEMVAQMTVEQQVNYFASKRSAAPRSDESFGAGWQIARQENAAEARAAQEEACLQHERELGLPRLRDRWCAERDAIAENAARERAEADQHYAGELQRIAERQERELAKLGEMPSLESLEAAKLTTTKE